MKTRFALYSFRTHQILFLAQGLAVYFLLLAGFSTQAQPGLVAQYAFNGTFFDQTTNGNHGTAIGNPSFVADRNGQVNSAIGLGGCDNPQFLRVPNSASLQGSDAMTVTFWARVELSSGMDPGDGTCTANGRQVFFAKAGDGYGVSPPGFLGLTYATDGQQRITFEGNAGQVNAVTSKELPGNAWHHYAYVLTASEVKLYIDAQLVRISPANLSFTEANQQDLYLGVMGPKSSPVLGITHWYPLNGALDDVRIFNRGLGATEVSTVFASDDAGSCVPAAATILPAGDALFCDGQPLTLKATAIAPEVQLQWQRDGQPIAQATLDSLVVSQPGAYLIKTTKRQDAWQSDIGGFETTMNDVQFVGGNVGWIVGDYGLFLKTTNGYSWDTIPMNRQDRLTRVNFVNTQIGFIGGANGLLLKTTNGAASFFQLNIPASGVISRIKFLNENTGYVLADRLLFKTTDGGTNWITVTLPNSFGLEDMAFVDTDFGWIASGTQVYKTDNGGNSWVFQTDLSNSCSSNTARFQKLYALNRNSCWALYLADCNDRSPNAILRTSNGGVTWENSLISLPSYYPQLSSLYTNDFVFNVNYG